MSQSGARKALRFLFQAAILLLATAALTEMAFRGLHWLSPVFIFPSNSYQQFRVKPFASIYGVKLNSKGFKDVEFKPVKQPGTFRILGIGDSFFFSVVPYQHNFLTVLEGDLAQRPVPVEVLNMGIPRTGVNDYHALLIHEGLPLDPDMVLLGFYIGNDFSFYQGAKDPRPRSFLFAFFDYLFRILPGIDGAMLSGSQNQWGYNDTAPSLDGETHRGILLSKLEWFRKNQPAFTATLPAVLGYLEEIQRICQHRHLRFLTVIIPDELQVDDATREEFVQTVPGYRAEDFDYDLPNRRLNAELARRGIAALDLLPVFRAAGQTKRLYKPRDTHWNIAGNHLAARTIRKTLVQNGWLP